jgi:DNA repair exonuclease SbcCD ATPase subunit
LKKIEQFQITSLMLSGFKSYEEPTELVFGNPTVITGGNGRGKSSIADAIAFAVTGCPFFGERGIDRLHNENNPDVAIRMCFVDETGTLHELNRTRRKNRMTITYDGYEIRQLDLADLFGERDVFLSILNPLYFIEELGEDGKKLLERYLPTIPHETVLSQLSEPVREHLKNETILSPEGSLKRCREEIRSLEERITYLRGQKDLAASQGESHEQAEQEVTLQADILRREIVELEQRQFSSMDVSAMQERLVELSGRYEEAARDERADTSKLREQLQLLREKIARREVEKYQSKFTEALAEASARVKDLGVRYQRENAAYKAFHAGMECPACHRSVTEQSLSEVQAALKKVLSELYAAGSEQRAQLIELQEMDKKAADTFARFKEDDLGKWAAEAAEMEQRCASLAEQASAETECLRAEIQTLTADLEYGNLSQAEYDRLGTCREELRQSEAKIAALQDMTAAQLPDFDREIAQANANIAEIKRKMADVIAYISKRAELTFSQLKMNRVEISLYDVVKSTGEVKDTFKFQYGGRRYDRLSLSEKIRAGMEVSELMKRLTGRNYPVFVDNMESVDDLANVRPTGQIIMAKCVSGAALQVKPIRPIAFAEQRAA